jgi:hypothetical protein
MTTTATHNEHDTTTERVLFVGSCMRTVRVIGRVLHKRR